MLDDLDAGLRKEVMIELYKDVVKLVPLFRSEPYGERERARACRTYIESERLERDEEKERARARATLQKE